MSIESEAAEQLVSAEIQGVERVIEKTGEKALEKMDEVLEKQLKELDSDKKPSVKQALKEMKRVRKERALTQQPNMKRSPIQKVRDPR
jgi:flagellar biosynthesis/type III secretory pathway protein FliH